MNDDTEFWRNQFEQCMQRTAILIDKYAEYSVRSTLENVESSDVIKLARDAGLLEWETVGIESKLRKFADMVAAAARQAEREACAALCHEVAPSFDGQLCAEAILGKKDR